MPDTKISEDSDVSATLDGTESVPLVQGGVNVRALLSAIMVPIGSIIMWGGTIASIPTYWALCDGTANAPGPDLRDRFIVGATQDDAGVAKTNIEGSLEVSGGVTGVSHSAHANLSHANGAVGDHTGLTHGLTISDHPDLTHVALSHPAITITHADHSLASFSGSLAAVTLSHADHSLASHSGTQASAVGSMAASTLTLTMGTQNIGVLTTPTAATRNTLSATTQTVPIASHTGSVPSGTHSHAASTLTHPDHSVASASHTHAAVTATHADHSVASLSHQAIGTHSGLAHTFTAPTAHGTAGTLTHSFTQPDAHAISAHDTVLSIPNYFALAFIQRMA